MKGRCRIRPKEMKTPDVAAHTCNPKHLGNVGKRISSSNPLLHSKFKASLGYMRPHLKANKKEMKM